MPLEYLETRAKVVTVLKDNPQLTYETIAMYIDAKPGTIRRAISNLIHNNYIRYNNTLGYWRYSLTKGRKPWLVEIRSISKH